MHTAFAMDGNNALEVEPAVSATRRVSEARMKRILESREQRMNKILGFNQDASEKQDNHVTKVEAVQRRDSESPSLTPSATLSTLHSQNGEPTAVPVGSDQRAAALTGRQHREDQQFPRKVSLISTPVDFRQNVISQHSWFSAQFLGGDNSNAIIVYIALLLTAAIGSLLQLPVVLPFLLAQSLKYGLRINSNSTSVAPAIGFYAAIHETTHEMLFYIFIFVIVQVLS